MLIRLLEKNMIKKILIILFFYLFINNSYAEEVTMILKLKNGNVIIELFPDVAPKHVERIKTLAKEKKCDFVGTTKM